MPCRISEPFGGWGAAVQTPTPVSPALVHTTCSDGLVRFPFHHFLSRGALGGHCHRLAVVGAGPGVGPEEAVGAGRRFGRKLPAVVCWISRLSPEGDGRCRRRGECSQRSSAGPAAPAERSGSGCSPAPRSRALAAIWRSQPCRLARSGGPALPGGAFHSGPRGSLRSPVGSVVPRFAQGGLSPHSGGQRHSLGKWFTRRQRDQSPQREAHPDRGLS